MRRLHRMRHLLPFAALTTAGPDDDPAFLGALSLRGTCERLHSPARDARSGRDASVCQRTVAARPASASATRQQRRARRCSYPCNAALLRTTQRSGPLQVSSRTQGRLASLAAAGCGRPQAAVLAGALRARAAPDPHRRAPLTTRSPRQLRDPCHSSCVCLIATARHRIVRLVAAPSRIVETHNVPGTMPNRSWSERASDVRRPRRVRGLRSGEECRGYPATTCLTSAM